MDKTTDLSLNEACNVCEKCKDLINNAEEKKKCEEEKKPDSYNNMNIMLNAFNYSQTTNSKVDQPSEFTYTDKQGNTIKTVNGAPRELTYKYGGNTIRLFQPHSIFRRLSGMGGLNFSD